MHALTELHLHVFAQKLRKAVQRNTLQHSKDISLQVLLKCCCVLFQSVCQLTHWLSSEDLKVHQTDYISLSWSIPLFFFYYLPSIPEPAMIPIVRGCCLIVPDLWNDDRGAGGPYPSVFIFPFCPPPAFTATTSITSSMLHWALVVVTLMVTDVPGRSGPETRPPPNVISAPASTCWLDPVVRPQ